MQQGYQDLKVWQKSKDFAVAVYKITADFPKSEIYGLTNQLRRAALSISSNLAEGYGRKSRKEMSRYVSIAIGSASEAQSLGIIAAELGYLNLEQSKPLQSTLIEILKMLEKLRQKLQS